MSDENSVAEYGWLSHIVSAGECRDVVDDEHDPAEGGRRGDGGGCRRARRGVGIVIAVRAGEVVPIDGVVVDGQSDVDERSVTGESFPVPKQPQSEVWAGTLNLDGRKLPFQLHSQTSESLKHLKILKCNNVHVVLCHVAGYIAVRTTALAENSTMAKMERLVEEPQNSRSKTQRLIDSCAKYYTPGTQRCTHLQTRSYSEDGQWTTNSAETLFLCSCGGSCSWGGSAPIVTRRT